MSTYGIVVAILKKDKETKSWSTTETIIPQTRDVSVSLGIGKKKDSFSFRLLNYNQIYFNGEDSFDVDDRIKIWMLKDQTWETMTSTQKNNTLAIDGIVTKPSESLQNGVNIKLSGKSWIESLFDTKLPIDKSGTLPEIVEEVITSAGNYNANRAVTWDTSNPITRSDKVTAHNSYVYAKNYKSVIEMLEELSSDKYTQDGTYIYWVTVDVSGNRLFHWTYKDNTVPSGNTFVEGTQEALNINAERSTDGMINTIIYVAGRDCEGNRISGINHRSTSSTSYGAKTKFIPETDYIAMELILAEKLANSSDFTQDANDNFTDDHYPTSYNYTLRFYTRDSTGVPDGGAYTVANDADYNEAIRTEARWIGKDKTNRVLDLYSAPRYKVKITIPRPVFNTYQIGKLMDITITSYNLSAYKLRLVETSYDFFTQTLMLEEDEKTALANLVI